LDFEVYFVDSLTVVSASFHETLEPIIFDQSDWLNALSNSL